LVLRYTVRFRYVREELTGRGADIADIDDITRGQVGYLIMLVSITAGLTAGVYFAVPFMSRIAQKPLSGLPAPHIMIGLLVVIIIAAATVVYLREE
jgi:hypothetical protein